MNAQDEAFLIQFSDKAEVVQEFTGSTKAIEDRMGSLKSGGLTALLDAVTDDDALAARDAVGPHHAGVRSPSGASPNKSGAAAAVADSGR